MTANRTVRRLIPESGPAALVNESFVRNVEKAISESGDTFPTAGVTDLNTLVGAILLAATNNVVLSVVGNTITLDGRIGPRFGYRWPSAAEDITITDADYGIYGTGGQGCHDVTFPLAADYPGKVVRFTFPPSGALIPTGGDTIDVYANQTSEFQSDGVSKWVRMWSV